MMDSGTAWKLDILTKTVQAPPIGFMGAFEGVENTSLFANPSACDTQLFDRVAYILGPTLTFSKCCFTEHLLKGR